MKTPIVTLSVLFALLAGAAALRDRLCVDSSEPWVMATFDLQAVKGDEPLLQQPQSIPCSRPRIWASGICQFCGIGSTPTRTVCCTCGEGDVGGSCVPTANLACYERSCFIGTQGTGPPDHCNGVPCNNPENITFCGTPSCAIYHDAGTGCANPG